MTFETTSTFSISGVSALLGLDSLWAETLGDPGVCVAVLDGPVDLSHPSFVNTRLTRLPTLVRDRPGRGRMSIHGTHITSIIFARHDGPVQGLAPNCRGLLVPVFSDDQKTPLSQLDLARAINQAVEGGAQVINVSGGERTESGEADQLLANAVQRCNEEGVLIVAAAGNDACPCLHVPAALPSVLAVGAMNARGLPFDFSNWGATYQTQGILAPGENILGAVPGGGIAVMRGTSFATPIVSGIVALLLSLQLKRGEKADPHAVRDAILDSALPCDPEVATDCRRYLVGSLNIPGAYALIDSGGKTTMSDQKPETAKSQPSEARRATNVDLEVFASQPEDQIIGSSGSSEQPFAGVQTAVATTGESSPTPARIAENARAVSSSNPSVSTVTPSNVVPAEGCGCANGSKPLVYALGTINYDFGTEARRDSFRQLMPSVTAEGVPFIDEASTPGQNFLPNPFDASQIVHYLAGFPPQPNAFFPSPLRPVPDSYPASGYSGNPSEAANLIWTLNIELTPIYAIEPVGPYANLVYERLVSALAGQLLSADDSNFVSRVSIPGHLSGKSLTLFSGQVVPVITPQLRGMFTWNTTALINGVVASVIAAREERDEGELPPEQEGRLRDSLEGFLNRIYFDLRNLGTTSQERALNYTATNAFQATEVLIQATGQGFQLDMINVERSPFCRMDSDCWDVRLTFFDPESNLRARRVFRFTIDVSDIMPVTVGEVRSWSIS